MACAAVRFLFILFLHFIQPFVSRGVYKSLYKILRYVGTYRCHVSHAYSFLWIETYHKTHLEKFSFPSSRFEKKIPQRTHIQKHEKKTNLFITISKESALFLWHLSRDKAKKKYKLVYLLSKFTSLDKFTYRKCQVIPLPPFD